MTPPVAEIPDLAKAVWRTWGARGLLRRAGYEIDRRSGRLRSAEDRWLAGPVPRLGLRSAGVSVPSIADTAAVTAGIDLYGGFHLDSAVPPEWHVHPVTGHRFPAEVHWSEISDADVEAGDIKDIWEPARFGWLVPRLRRWAASGDEEIADEIWRVVEDWVAANPPYRGVHWMCGQETSLRSITAMFLADALRTSPATTAERLDLVTAMVHHSVGRVAPTVAYAMSQRNNHAVSEAGFLWSATLLVTGLPDAQRLRRRAAAALTEIVADQFAPDGSYSQHSPTYQRVAMQVLLWCAAVASATGEPLPTGVPETLGRGASHLRSLLVAGSEGRVPNLGNNDGAHVLALSGCDIGDFRPLLVHTRAALGATTDIPPGPWDEEAGWFGLEARRSATPTTLEGVATRTIEVGGTHVVFRAGPISHRPAHADQLHVDIWFDGQPVAIDAGTYRYTAAPPWANALAGEDVHNLPRVPGEPQAVRAGRFFWKAWATAEIVERVGTGRGSRTARLTLPRGSVLTRSVEVHEGAVVVLDRLEGVADGVVRWNLADAVSVVGSRRGTDLRSRNWSVRLVHAGTASVRMGDPDDPTSGWSSRTYAVRDAVTCVEIPLEAGGSTVSVFSVGAVDDDRLDAVVMSLT